MSYRMDIQQRNQLINTLNVDPVYWQLSSNPAAFGKNMIEKMGTLFGDGISDSQVIELMLYRHLRSIMQNSYQSAAEKLALLKDLSFHKSKYFHTEFNLLEEGAASKVFMFSQKTPREDIMGEICEFADLNINSARSSKAIQTAEELLMNVQITAPLQKPKTDSVSSMFKVEYTDQLLAFSAIDDYGSLDCKKFLKKIESCLAIGRDKSINYGKGGAGLGSSLIFQNCDSLFLGVNPNKKTRVSVIMPYNVTERKFDEIQRSVHIIELKA